MFCLSYFLWFIHPFFSLDFSASKGKAHSIFFILI